MKKTTAPGLAVAADALPGYTPAGKPVPEPSTAHESALPVKATFNLARPLYEQIDEWTHANKKRLRTPRRLNLANVIRVLLHLCATDQALQARVLAALDGDAPVPGKP